MGPHKTVSSFAGFPPIIVVMSEPSDSRTLRGARNMSQQQASGLMSHSSSSFVSLASASRFPVPSPRSHNPSFISPAPNGTVTLSRDLALRTPSAMLPGLQPALITMSNNTTTANFAMVPWQPPAPPSAPVLALPPPPPPSTSTNPAAVDVPFFSEDEELPRVVERKSMFVP